MKRYLKLFKSLLQLSAKLYFEQRANTYGLISAAFVSLFISYAIIDITFTFTPDLLGWTKEQVLFMNGTVRIVMGLFSFLFLGSVNAIPEYVQNGEMDLFLTKPINSQFFVSLRMMRPYEIFSSISGLLFVIYSLVLMNNTFSFYYWTVLIFGLIIGLVILYSLYFAIGTTAIWMIRFTALQELFYLFREPITIPIDIYGKGLGFILTFLIPLGFIITVPVGMFFSIKPVEYMIIGIILSIIFFTFSVWFWNFALRHYTSASS